MGLFLLGVSDRFRELHDEYQVGGCNFIWEYHMGGGSSWGSIREIKVTSLGRVRKVEGTSFGSIR